MLIHPRHLIRDTAHCKMLCPVRPLSLKQLARQHCGLEIQRGEHDSVEDARAALMVYKSVHDK